MHVVGTFVRIVWCMLSVRRLSAFAPRLSTVSPWLHSQTHFPKCRQPNYSRWMTSSSSDVLGEKTEEEKAALKALREEKK
jgi:hypothetical protein